MNIIDMLWISERKFYLLLFSRGNFLSGDETDFGVRFLPRFWPGVLSWASHQALRTSFTVQICLAHNVFVCSLWWWQGVATPRPVCTWFFWKPLMSVLIENAATVACLHLGWTVNSCISFKLDRWSWKVNRSRAMSPLNVLRAIISNWGILW